VSGEIVLAVANPFANGPKAGFDKFNVANKSPAADVSGVAGFVPVRISMNPLGLVVPASSNPTIALPAAFLAVNEILIILLSSNAYVSVYRGRY
jgi:hypothetical protein